MSSSGDNTLLLAAGHKSVVNLLADDPWGSITHQTSDHVAAASAARAGGHDTLSQELTSRSGEQRPMVHADDLDRPPPSPDQTDPATIRSTSRTQEATDAQPT